MRQGKRRRKVLRDNTAGMTEVAIRRLAGHAGVQRIPPPIYEANRGRMKTSLEHVIRDAVAESERAGRETVTAADVAYGLKRQQIGVSTTSWEIARRLTKSWPQPRHPPYVRTRRAASKDGLR